MVQIIFMHDCPEEMCSENGRLVMIEAQTICQFCLHSSKNCLSSNTQRS
jgi:hypothetical protein